jgi:hypothetical protein
VTTIQRDRIEFDDAGEGGIVWYLLLSPLGVTDEDAQCAVHPRSRHDYLVQRFRTGPQQLAGPWDGRWQWDGNRDAPTLSPSFLCRDKGVHLFFTAGHIALCGDSTVTLAVDPQPCAEALR